MRRLITAAAIATSLVLAVSALAFEAPKLVFEGPLASRAPDVSKEALEDLVEMVGLATPGDPIHVLLVDEKSEEAKSAPPWVVGYTDGVSSVVVLLPARTPTYPDGALAEVLCHEVAHVLIARAAAGRTVPRWLNEGVAMMAGRSWGLRDQTELALELFHGKRVPIHRLDALFAGDREAVRRAYALSGALVKSLVERHGSGLPRALLSRLARGLPFETAFREVTGRTLDEAGEDFFREQTAFRRWIPILTSSAFAWFAVSILALLAIRRKRVLDRARRADWERSEPEEPYEFVEESELDSTKPQPPS